MKPRRLHSILLTVLITVLLCACATTTTVDDNSTIDQTKSASDSIATRQATNEGVLVGIKSLLVNSDSKTKLKIIFVDSGGSYDTNTGKADGVKEVNQDQQIIVDSTAIEHWKGMYFNSLNELTIVRDSLNDLKQQNDITTKKETKSTWWSWLLIGAVGMFTIIVTLKKIPQTSWLLFWL